MDASRAPVSAVGSSGKWSLCAGVYMFVCGVATTLLLSDVLVLLADAIGLTTRYWMIVLASPAFAIGAVVWWTTIERRGSYTYPLGGAFGVITTLLAGLLWTAQFIRFWGFEMIGVPMIAFLTVFVLGSVATVGVLTALPLMYARRRLVPSDATA